MLKGDFMSLGGAEAILTGVLEAGAVIFFPAECLRTTAAAGFGAGAAFARMEAGLAAVSVVELEAASGIAEFSDTASAKAGDGLTNWEAGEPTVESCETAEVIEVGEVAVVETASEA